jgi:hypothetical protein
MSQSNSFMMSDLKKYLRYRHCAGLFLYVLVILIPLFWARNVAAAGDDPPGPDRYIWLEEEYYLYIWWLVNYNDGKVECIIETDREGLPGYEEIGSFCSGEMLAKWKAQLP